ncbi:recombinase family protein [Rhodococcus aetherivorans]|uniref:recombinase family protein n=1 Tax=Rhodococcus aetherivorans TaxID=191292 RepID=UPI00241EE903|nr:recombinase family protein [Rhodococcus aetherivorans]WFS15181.1 recombinase family protein [Rhodococcus aetherivorans]
MTDNLRVLGRLRLSRATDESTSIERQRDVIEQWASAHGHRVVGWAEDVDVSGSVDPFDTPGLGPWLRDRTEDWDVLAAWKLDRLGRNAIQLNKLFGWCGEHGKTLVSCSESIDLGSWAGRMLAGVIAGLAEGELEAIRERSRSSRAKLRASARFAGGKPPFGYRAAPLEGGGWTLQVDPVAAPLVRDIVADAIDGKPVHRIAQGLNSEGYLSPRHYHSTVKAGAPRLQLEPGEERLSKWETTSVRNLLRSPTLRGYVHHDGRIIRDDDGLPLQFAEALVDPDEWEALQAALDNARDRRSKYQRPDSGPLSGVLTCAFCGRKLNVTRQTKRQRQRTYYYTYYRCPDIADHPGASLIPAELAETLVEEQFLDDVGDLPVRERVWVSGDSREQELREAVRALDDLTQLVGTMTSETARERLAGQISAIDTRIRELEAQPAREAHWEYREVGGTYRDVWQSLDTEGRRTLLLKSGISVALGITGRLGPKTPGALQAHIHVPEPLAEALAR